MSVFSALALLSVLGVRAAAADTPAVPPPPANLAMQIASTGSPLAAGSWIGSTQITFRFDVKTTTGLLTPEVELQPSSVPFRGQANVSAASLSTSGRAAVSVEGLANGQTYHWQARVLDSSGLASPWVPYGPPGTRTPDFGVDQNPPSRPVIHSATNPSPNRWYHNRAVSLRWSSTDPLSGIKGYSYVVTRRPQVNPPAAIQPQSQIWLRNLADGAWFVSVRSVDRAGNWSSASSYRLQLDRQAPRVTWLGPNRFTFNPFRGPVSIRFQVNEDSALRLRLYRVGDRKPVHVYTFPHLSAGRIVSLLWSGKDRTGRPVARGYYFFRARAIDRARNTARSNLAGIQVNPQQPFRSPSGLVLYPEDGKRIIVSLSRQTLYAYDGVRLFLQTFVTTGNPALPTPPGSYRILAKYHPFQFISPWPPGSPYWYPPSWSQYAMLFRAGGYFLHDAPWRSTFGPGTNGPGQAGTNFGGTHGCVNIPPNPMISLWNWTPVGTPVLVVP